jgi:hypothetical protein
MTKYGLEGRVCNALHGCQPPKEGGATGVGKLAPATQTEESSLRTSEVGEASFFKKGPV